MLESAILKAFNTSFVTYYKSHVSHWNIQSRQFLSDHKLLEKIYEDIFDSIDNIAEIIRTLEITIPSTLGDIINDSDVDDSPIYDSGDGIDYLQTIYDDLKILIVTFQDLEEVSSDLKHSHIENFCQDRVKALEKFCWMLRSTLQSRI